MDSTSARSLAVGAPAPMPGALTKPIDEYSGDEFFAFVRGLQYTSGAERQRTCKSDPSCVGTNPKKHTMVMVDAVGLQDSISAGTTPKFGVVYVRAVNKGDAEEARYGLKPGPNIEYYTIILADSTGTMTWRMEMLDTQARLHSSAGTGVFRGCNHPWVKGARADFKTCAKAMSAKDTLGAPGNDDPIWTACGSGCCVEDPT